MVGELLPGTILCRSLIPNLSPSLARTLELPDRTRSIGILSCDSDDLLYLALDEATKDANVEVVYARSLYAGAPMPPRPWPGRSSACWQAHPRGGGQRPGPGPAIPGERRGLPLRRAGQPGGVSGPLRFPDRQLSGRVAQVPVGQANTRSSVAPPVEALVGLDAALKASDVDLAQYFAPPTETNFSGGLLTGTQSACQAACDAFAAAVTELAAHPKEG